jgi:hypothetical protein
MGSAIAPGAGSRLGAGPYYLAAVAGVPISFWLNERITEWRMARQPVSKGGTSRIRFIMLDAELPEGDLSQITSAIQNALKPTTIVQQRLPNQPAAPALISNGAAGEPINDEPSELGEAAAVPEAARPAREPRARKPTVPKVLDLDLTTGVSLESYASEHPPKSEPDRHLVVAAWFKEHRGEDAITVGHVYTCYRAMKWSAAKEDFSWPLRALKKDQLMTSPGRGQYAINNLGLARVQDMRSE